jgi:hypothetical protein
VLDLKGSLVDGPAVRVDQRGVQKAEISAALDRGPLRSEQNLARLDGGAPPPELTARNGSTERKIIGRLSTPVAQRLRSKRADVRQRIVRRAARDAGEHSTDVELGGRCSGRMLRARPSAGRCSCAAFARVVAARCERAGEQHAEKPQMPQSVSHAASLA